MKPFQIAFMVALPLAASIGTVTGDAYAASGTCSSQLCSDMLITSIVIHPDGGAGSPAISAEVKFDAPVSGSPGCTLNGGYWEISPGRDNTIKALTAAYLAGKKVIVKSTAATGTCFVAWAGI